MTPQRPGLPWSLALAEDGGEIMEDDRVLQTEEALHRAEDVELCRLAFRLERIVREWRRPVGLP